MYKRQATGIAYCGSNIGGALAIVVLGNLIERIGWQWAYAASGLLGLLLLIPIILLFIREKPQDMGLQPYRRSATAVIQTDAPTIQHSGMLLSKRGALLFSGFCSSRSSFFRSAAAALPAI